MFLEHIGIQMPVVEIQCKYLRPALYDDLLRVRTVLPKLPTDHRIEFHQEIYRDPDELLFKAQIKLYFWDKTKKEKSVMGWINSAWMGCNYRRRRSLI